VLDQISSSTFICDGIRISLLAEEDGKQHLATVTTGIHKAVSTGYIAKEDVDVDFVQEKVYCKWCKETILQRN
jgi:undecaprenyl pyrophosphate synthase